MAQCASFDIVVEDLMSQQALTQLVVVAHDPSASLFTVGQVTPDPTRDFVDEEDADMFDGFLVAADALICGAAKVDADGILGTPLTTRLDTVNKASCNCNTMVISVISSLKERCVDDPLAPGVYNPDNCVGMNDAFVGLRNHRPTSFSEATSVDIGVYDTGYSRNQPQKYMENSGGTESNRVTPHRGSPFDDAQHAGSQFSSTFNTNYAARVTMTPVAVTNNNNWLLWASFLFGH